MRLEVSNFSCSGDPSRLGQEFAGVVELVGEAGL